MREYNRTSLAFKPSEDIVPEVTGNNYIDLPLDITAFSDPVSDATAEEGGKCSIADALMKSIRDTGRVDMIRIARDAGVTVREAINDLRGAVYCDPDKWDGTEKSGWVMADEYLSGNLRQKLVKARQAFKLYKGTFKDNVRALEKLLPPEMKAEDIYVSLGSPWLPAEIIEDFVNYLIQPHENNRITGILHDIDTGSWEIPNKGQCSCYVRNTSTYGTPYMTALQIIERTLNMKAIQVTDEVPSNNSKSGKTRGTNKEKTVAAQEKQKLILNEFRRWIWQDESRKQKVKSIYERKYGHMVARRFDGRFLEFPGMSDSVRLYPYQKDAVARILFTPNTLLAHDVGAGKTYIMIAAAMELKRLKMAERCMFVVPNNLVGQWRRMFLDIYPNASLLCVGPADMDPEHRNLTKQRIKKGNYDGIIIAYSCFDRIPLSKDARIEALEAERKKLRQYPRRSTTAARNRRLDKISKEFRKTLHSNGPGKGDICFDELGIDMLFVDEAHNYKNVSVETFMTGVYGINRKGSAKCDSMMSKVHYVQKTHNGGGVVMATGTPITNSISDIYVFQKYLQSGELELLGLQTFDNWVGMFAEKTTEFEIAVDTNSFRLATRFSGFHNIPELTTILASIADFHNTRSGGALPELGGYTDVLIPRSAALRDYLKEISKRADRVHNHEVKRDEDNMLKITSDGRKAALDIRLVNKRYTQQGDPLYGGLRGRCKAGECAERAARIWHATKKERLTQLIFCDISTPKTGFNMYDEMKYRLVDLGVDEQDIAFIHDANTESRRKKLFSAVRDGHIRILIGSTFKLGLGVNVQDRLITIHHLDIPWRPADMIQREGRILREGNLNPKIEIYRYICEGSFDAYSWQLLEIKQKFITDILSGTVAGRSGSDVDDTVLDYAEVKALALGNPLLKSRVETCNEITRLSILRRKGLENRMRLEQRYSELPDLIAAKEHELTCCKADAAFVFDTENAKWDFGNKRETDPVMRKMKRNMIVTALLSARSMSRDRSLFKYRGFMIAIPARMEAEDPFVYLVREGRYRVNLGDKERGYMIRIDNYLDGLDERSERLQRELDILLKEQAETEVELIETDDYGGKIEEYTARLEEIDRQLGIDEIKKQNVSGGLI